MRQQSSSRCHSVLIVIMTRCSYFPLRFFCSTVKLSSRDALGVFCWETWFGKDLLCIGSEICRSWFAVLWTCAQVS